MDLINKHHIKQKNILKVLFHKWYNYKGGNMEKQDIRLMIGAIKFSCRAVAVIEKNGKILFLIWFDFYCIIAKYLYT